MNTESSAPTPFRSATSEILKTSSKALQVAQAVVDNTSRLPEWDTTKFVWKLPDTNHLLFLGFTLRDIGAAVNEGLIEGHRSDKMRFSITESGRRELLFRLNYELKAAVGAILRLQDAIHVVLSSGLTK